MKNEDFITLNVIFEGKFFYIDVQFLSNLKFNKHQVENEYLQKTINVSTKSFLIIILLKRLKLLGLDGRTELSSKCPCSKNCYHYFKGNYFMLFVQFLSNLKF